MWLFISVLLLVYLFYKFAIVPWSYWKKRGIAHITPVPLFGNLFAVLTGKRNFLDHQQAIYAHFPNERYFGQYELTTPSLYIKDLELIKRIVVKDFDHFMDHRSIASNNDPLLYKTLISLRGHEWREMRAFLSPTFTSSKMRGMFELMAACARGVTKHYLEMNATQVEVELKDLFTRYTNDVIATCAFGVECDSFKNPKNEFFEAGQAATNFSGLRGVKMMIANFAPKIYKHLKLRLFSSKFTDFFIRVIKETIEYRESEGVIRPDLIHLLLEARKGLLKHGAKQEENDQGFAAVEESTLGKTESRLEGLSDLDIVSQCFIFYIAGFDTASTTMSFGLTELAINPDVQNKLYEEIDGAMNATGGKLTYEVVMKMKYLDMVVSETLRKWPPAPAIDRICTKDFHIEPTKPSEVLVVIKKGEGLFIPVAGIHKDPKYFPDPERFDPERFSDENKDNIVPYSYMPFGIGPRSCIASRFALLETKILMAEFLHKFEVVVVNKTSVPIVLTTTGFKLSPVNGFWVGIKKRA